MSNSTTIAAPGEKKLSKLEGLKERSNFLREPLVSELREDTTHFTQDGIQILKFHGSYQQDNRDNRVKGQEKDYQMMIRTRSPGGYIPPELYLTLDRLSDQYGNHTLRATTRQGFQLHGILKKNLKSTIAAIVRNMGSTLGACGDLNRNVMAPPAPFQDRPEYDYARRYANNIADLLTPQTGAYYEIWLDGEKIISGEENPAVKEARRNNNNGTLFQDGEEPIYGTHYMPRKFKISVTVPGDNSVDIYTQDVGLVVISDEQGKLAGFNILAGGGLGRTHNKEETFARIADHIGYVAKEDVYELVKAIVATQRDYGERHNRRQARMKYLINDWGVDKFRETVEGYFGKKIEPFKPLPEWKYEDFLGWHDQGDGFMFVGISIDNGRVFDNGSLKLKTALREIVEKFNTPMLVSPHQNVILYDIKPENQQDIQKILAGYGVKPETAIDPLVRTAMACPALPTCGLAITESERAIPGILDRIRTLLNKLGLEEEQFVVRMTGCPNGCARPYVAELGFVGSAPNSYQIWLGGSASQTRLAQPVINKLNIDHLEAFLTPILVNFKQNRQPGEGFGDFCDRIGFDTIGQLTTNYQQNVSATTSSDMTTELMTAPTVTDDVTGITATTSEDTSQEEQVEEKERRPRRRVNLSEDIYHRLKAEAARQGKPMSELAARALEAFLAEQQSEDNSEDENVDG
jgi:sulfite reductase (ferredoxin)